MNRKEAFRRNTAGDSLSAADITALVQPAVGTAVADYVTAKYVAGPVSKVILTLASLPITMTDAGAAGCHGSAKLLDFAENVKLFLGASCDLTTLAGSGGITDTAALVASLGTVTTSAADATLTTTEADLIPSTAGTLVAGAGTIKGESTSTEAAKIHNGSTTPVDAYLNFAIPDAGSTASDTLTVSGTVTLVFANLGDN